MPSDSSPRVFGIGISTPIFLLSAILIFLFYTMSSDPSLSNPARTSPPQAFHYKYTVEKGLFKQSEDSTDDTNFDFKKEHFGLINRSYPTDDTSPSPSPWPRFQHYIRTLNSTLPSSETIKVLFLARHGQGWHNVAESKYGTKAWDCHYSLLNGSPGLTWADAHLTPLGSEQATRVQDLWAAEFDSGLGAPETYYVSPLTRTLQTADLTFKNLPLPSHATTPYIPRVKELLREAIGVHTCDRRSSASIISSTFPHAVFESGFSEADMLWQPDYREPRSARRYRLEMLLDDVFASDEGVFLSFTSHSGAIASLLEGVGHREFKLETGGVVPVVVRGVRVEGARRVPDWEPSEGPPLCDGPPEKEGEDGSVGA